MMKNDFYRKVQEAEWRGATPDELKSLLGRARAKKGMFEGDLEKGELEIGQVSSLIDEIQSVEDIFKEILKEIRDFNYNQKMFL